MHITYDNNCVRRDNTDGARGEKLKHFYIIIILLCIMLFNIWPLLCSSYALYSRGLIKDDIITTALNTTK